MVYQSIFFTDVILLNPHSTWEVILIVLILQVNNWDSEKMGTDQWLAEMELNPKS